jgi:hypothetical protein
MSIGLALGIWDYESILAWPEHVFAHWRARFLIKPWDAANLAAIAKYKIKPPDWVQGMIEDQERREKAQRGNRGTTIRRLSDRSRK